MKRIQVQIQQRIQVPHPSACLHACGLEEPLVVAAVANVQLHNPGVSHVGAVRGVEVSQVDLVSLAGVLSEVTVLVVQGEAHAGGLGVDDAAILGAGRVGVLSEGHVDGQGSGGEQQQGSEHCKMRLADH